MGTSARFPDNGGGSNDAGDLTTGTLAAARLPGVLANVDTQAELLSAAAAAAASHTHAASDIASGTVATARLGSGSADSTTFLRGDSTWATASDATKLPLAGGTLSGPLVVSATNVQLTGSGSSAGTTTENFFRNSSGYSVWNVNDRFLITRQGVTTFQHVPTVGTEFYNSAGTFSLSIAHSAPGGSTRGIHCNGGTTDLYANVPTGGVWGVSVNGTAQSTMGTGGLQFPTAHTAPGNVCAIWRYGTSNPGVVIQSPTDGYSMLAANTSGASPRIYIAGTGLSGAAFIEPAPVSLAAAGTRTVMTSATTRSGSVEVMNTTDGKRATFSVENGTPVKIEGDASFVAGAPGASQIGLELSSTTLRINNGYATSKLIAFVSRLA